ncbi:hypothetical protein M1C57_01785 [Rhodococcus pyridinivorans]|uniref:hypothetical protein n=1 Tax=Rhodococcus pyridinivorans TaxID=103816 RepID=UPI00200A2C22|nr:hypothetical protein [Rhodococcus pyridinivorans]UPW04839.1 hypothetical protein M1C57_01785 [Rhodococcus pyridinivorans]
MRIDAIVRVRRCSTHAVPTIEAVNAHGKPINVGNTTMDSTLPETSTTPDRRSGGTTNNKIGTVHSTEIIDATRSIFISSR